MSVGNENIRNNGKLPLILPIAIIQKAYIEMVNFGVVIRVLELTERNFNYFVFLKFL